MHIKRPAFISTKAERAQLEHFIDAMLAQIASRGRDSTGFVAATFDGGVRIQKEAIGAEQFIPERDRLPKGTQSVLLHTRFATKGHQSVWGNNHPVVYKDVFTTHNGSIRNDDELFEKHELERVAEVDTEIIPALLSKYGFEDAKEAFEQLKGGFATANIRPIKNKGTVLLAKGPSFPLVYLDSKDFFVWASTGETIRKAFEAINLPTPTTHSIKYASEGTFIWLTDDQVVVDTKGFKAPSFQSNNYSGHSYMQHQAWGGDEDEDWADAWERWDAYQDRSTKSSGVRTDPTGGFRLSPLASTVLTIRSEGKGLAFTWAQKSSMPAEIKDLHNGRWHMCNFCHDTVIQKHTVKSPAWGEMCLDCYAIKTNNHPALTGKEKPRPEIMEKIDIQELEDWVEIEGQIHTAALAMVGETFGLSPDAVDFVLFRLSTEYLNSREQYGELYAELDDAYNECSNAAWKAYAEKWKEEEDKKRDGGYVSCHGAVHKADETCEKCAPEGDACGVQAFAEDQELSVDKLLEKTVNGQRKCASCKKRATVFIGLIGAWCGKHYRKCSVRGCKAETVGFTKDGYRRCHVHLRRMKGAYFDNDKQRLRKEAQQRAKTRPILH